MAFLRDKDGTQYRMVLDYEKKVNFLKQSLHFEPRGEQFRLLESSSTQRFVTLIAGTRFGKSMIASADVAAEICLLPQRTKKALIWWIVAPDYDLGALEFDYIYDFIVEAGFIPCDKNQVPANDYKNGYVTRTENKKPTINVYYPLAFDVKKDEYSFQRGISQIQIRSADTQNARTFQGREVDGLIFSECSQLNNLKYLLEHRLYRAVGSRVGRVIMPTTPDGLGYLKDVICARGDKDSNIYHKDWITLGPYASTEGNFSKDEYEYMKDLIGEDSPGFQEQYMGLFVPRSGRVYKNFFEKTHVFTKAQEDKYLLAHANYNNYQIYLGIDFGFQNPCACVFAAKIGEQYVVFDEIHQAEMPIHDFGNEIKGKLEHYGIQYYQAFADIDHQQTIILRKMGVYTQPARKHDQQSSIEYVRNQFHINAASKKPNIMVSERCKKLIKELMEYHYKEETTDVHNPSELPVKKDDHACDALRYMIWTPSYMYSKQKKEKVA